MPGAKQGALPLVNDCSPSLDLENKINKKFILITQLGYL